MSEAWYDKIVRKGKCDVCGEVKPLQWDTPEGHLCHDCLCNSEKGLELVLNLVDYDSLSERLKESDRKDTLFVYVCDKCGKTLDMEIDSEFAKIPFESSWACKCGNFIRIKWDGKELKYIK